MGLYGNLADYTPMLRPFYTFRHVYNRKRKNNFVCTAIAYNLVLVFEEWQECAGAQQRLHSSKLKSGACADRMPLCWCVQHRGKTYAHASTLAFPVCTIFLVLCLFSRKFCKVCNKQLSLLLQQKSMKEYVFLFLNFISLSGKEIPKILAAMQGVRTSVSVITNRCLLFSSS